MFGVIFCIEYKESLPLLLKQGEELLKSH